MKKAIKLPNEIIRLCKTVIPLREVYKNRHSILKATGAVYCLWWIRNRGALLSSNRRIKLRGPNKKLIDLEFKNWFPEELTYLPLYVGKTTNLKSRISQHLLLKSPFRVHNKPINYEKVRPKTTSCQLRAGIEHIFPNINNPKDFILQNIGLSFVKVNGKDSVTKRFYLEDFAIGYLKPWFNLDSER